MLTVSEGWGSAAVPETVKGILNSNSFPSALEAKSARFKDAVPILGTLFFSLWFKPWIKREWFNFNFISNKKYSITPVSGRKIQSHLGNEIYALTKKAETVTKDDIYNVMYEIYNDDVDDVSQVINDMNWGNAKSYQLSYCNNQIYYSNDKVLASFHILNMSYSVSNPTEPYISRFSLNPIHQDSVRNPAEPYPSRQQKFHTTK